MKKKVASVIGSIFAPIVINMLLQLVELNEKIITLRPPWSQYYLSLKITFIGTVYLIITAFTVASYFEDLATAFSLNLLDSLELLIFGIVLGDQIQFLIGFLGIIIWILALVAKLFSKYL